MHAHTHLSFINLWVFGTQTFSRIYSPYLQPLSVGAADAPAVHMSMLLTATPDGDLGVNPHRVTPKGSLLPVPAVVSHQSLRAPQERVLSLVWAGWWCHANTSGRTNTDFEGFSISVCLLLPFDPYKLYFLYVFFFKLIVCFFLKHSGNGHFPGYLCCSETNGTHTLWGISATDTAALTFLPNHNFLTRLCFLGSSLRDCNCSAKL